MSIPTLSDDQIAAIDHAARPLQVGDREPFIQAVRDHARPNWREMKASGNWRTGPPSQHRPSGFGPLREPRRFGMY